jgi:hypothetical protein
MKTWPFAVLLLGLAFAPLAKADVPPPPPKDPTYPLVIEAYPKVAEARLIVPRKMLGKVKAALDGQETEQRAGLSPTHTIIAGGALAMALAFSGLWLVRKGPGGVRSLVLLVGAVAFLGIGTALWADGVIRRPPVPVNRFDRVVIEVTDKGDEVKLIVNKGVLTKALEAKK